MKTIGIILIALVSLTLLTSSLAQVKKETKKAPSLRNLAGRYQRSNDSGRHFTLKPDGTYEANLWGCTETGRWKLEGNKLVLYSELSSFKIKGVEFEDAYEDKWSMLSERDLLVQEFNDIAASAYQYRLRPRAFGGGEGSYEGFTIPSGRFDDLKILKVSPNQIVIEKNGIQGIIDRDGRVTVK